MQRTAFRFFLCDTFDRGAAPVEQHLWTAHHVAGYFVEPYHLTTKRTTEERTILMFNCANSSVEHDADPPQIATCTVAAHSGYPA
jgi:hypothetical protein